MNTMAWCDHPICKHCNRKLVRDYIQRMVEDGFLSKDERLDLKLVPYRASLRTETVRKMMIPAHKMIFLCEERSLYPLILQRIYRYYMNEFIKGNKRREIVDLILSEVPPDRVKQVKMFMVSGCRLGDIIERCQLHYIYKLHPNIRVQIYYCRIK